MSYSLYKFFVHFKLQNNSILTVYSFKMKLVRSWICISISVFTVCLTAAILNDPKSIFHHITFQIKLKLWSQIIYRFSFKSLLALKLAEQGSYPSSYPIRPIIHPTGTRFIGIRMNSHDIKQTESGRNQKKTRFLIFQYEISSSDSIGSYQ